MNQSVVAWREGIEINRETAEDNGIWDAASYDELTRFGIEDFIKNDWNPHIWIKELIHRFTKLPVSEPKYQKFGLGGYRKMIRGPKYEYTRPRNHVGRFQVAERLFEIILEPEIEKYVKFKIIMIFQPSKTEDDWGSPSRNTQHWWEHLVEWAEDNEEKDGIVGEYAHLLLLLEEDSKEEFVNRIIEYINISNDTRDVNILMSLLCGNIPFFALQWASTGKDLENGDSIENIRQIINTDLEYDLD